MFEEGEEMRLLKECVIIGDSVLPLLQMLARIPATSIARKLLEISYCTNLYATMS